MSMTFANQQTLLSVLLGDSNTGTDDAFPLATRKLFINRGEMQFARDTKLVREKATGTISGSSLAVPSDWLGTIALIVNNTVLNETLEVDIRDYDRWYASSSTRPAFYMSEESGSRYFKFLGSSTGQAYSLYYFKKPSTDLSGDSDTSIFPDEYREASVYWAASELLQQVGKNTIADKYAAKYNNYVREGQRRAEEMYLTKMYANPDINAIDLGEQDVAGYGYDFA